MGLNLRNLQYNVLREEISCSKTSKILERETFLLRIFIKKFFLALFSFGNWIFILAVDKSYLNYSSFID